MNSTEWMTEYMLHPEVFEEKTANITEGDAIREFAKSAATGKGQRTKVEAVICGILGEKHNTEKHGIDGEISEIKTCSTGGSITINDVSQSIFDKYDAKENFQFAFAYMNKDGRLLALFIIPWAVLRTTYSEHIQPGSSNFSIQPSAWLGQCTVRWHSPMALKYGCGLPNKMIDRIKKLI